MNDVIEEFINIPDIFENFGNDSNILLFSGCMKFMKLQ
jgi:hypothetical protein